MAAEALRAVLRQIRKWSNAEAVQDLPDGQLLGSFIRRRDESAFSELVRRHGRLVLSVCRQVLHHHQDTEDAFQATFLVLAKKAGSIRKRDSLASWLHGVAYRVAMKAYQQRRRIGRVAGAESSRPRHLAKSGASPRSAPATRQADSPAGEAALRELQTLLHEEVNRLPQKLRAPFVLCCLEGKSQAEAAAQLGWKGGTLGGRLAQARHRLRQRLGRRGVTLSTFLGVAALASPAASAAVPPALTASTTQAAFHFVTGKGAGTISAPPLGLAESVMKTMALTKLKVGVTLVLAATLLATGVGLAAYQALPAQPAAAAPQNPPKPLAKVEDRPEAAEGKPARTDRFGDPLPEGALLRLGTMRFRHGNGASVAFGSDGKTLLTVGGDRTIRTWDPLRGRLLRELKLPPYSYTNALVLSPDGRLLAFQEWGTQGFFYLWDVEQNRLRHKLPLDEAWSHEAVFSPDSKTLVTAQYSGILRTWDVATGQGRILGRHKREIRTLSFATDGTLMTMSMDQTIRFWDLAKGQEKQTWPPPENVAGAVLSPDGQTVATWNWHNEDKDKGVEFWETATGKPKKKWITPNLKQVYGIRFTPDGKELLIGAREGITIWDAATGKSRYTIAGPSGQEITFSPDGRTVAALGGGDANFPHGSVLFVWDLASGTSRAPNAPDHGHLGQVDSIAFSPDGRTIASSSQHDRTMRLWDAGTGRLLRTLPIADEMNFHSLSFTPDGKFVLQGTTAAIVRWDAATGREASRFPLYQAGKEDRQHLNEMRITDDGRTLQAVSQNLDARGDPGPGYGSSWHAFQAWDMASGKRLRSMSVKLDSMWFGYSCFSPDGRLLVVPGGTILDTTSGKELLKLTVEGKSLGMPVAISRDGAYVAQQAYKEVNRGNWHGTEMLGVQVWELATLLPVARLETGPLAHLAFTPDGRRLITAGPEALQLWDIASAKVLTQRKAPARFRGSYGDSFVSSMALAPDGHTVATGHVDSTILLWDLAAPAPDHPAAPLDADQLGACWNDLAGADAGRAFAALARLADVPEQAVRLLRDHLRPAKAPAAEELRQLLKDLDDVQFSRREAATKRLAELAELAEAALREALARKPSREARRRIEELLAGPRLVQAPEARRHLRAVRLLEQIATPEAGQVLKTLAQGAPEARPTQEAKASLERLAKRGAGSP